MNYKITYKYFNGSQDIIETDYMISESNSTTYTMQTALRDFKVFMDKFPNHYKIISIEEV